MKYTIMERKTLKNEVIEIFGEKTIDSFKKFITYIDSRNPDIIVLMARKAICLFELFRYLDLEKPKGEIVGDRVLDLEPDYFRGKKIIIVDDTLIVGSTLSEIKEKLISYGINFEIVVFSVDNVNWQKHLIIPDYIQEPFSPEEILNFCINEVKAFSLVSLPYLVDFPTSNFIKIEKSEFKDLLSSDKTSAVSLGLYLNPLNELYTFLFENELKEQFLQKVGFSFKDIIEVIKVRVYVSYYSDAIPKVKFVPIVLLKPLTSETINVLFNYIIEYSEDPETFKRYIGKTEVKLRIIQYYLSVTLGTTFLKYASTISSNFKSAIFNCSETINLFGKTLSELFEKLLKADIIKPCRLLVSSNTQLDEYNAKFDDVFSNLHIEGYNILQSFQKIFSNLFDLRELPARKFLISGNKDKQFLNRLKKGIPFNKIVSFFSTELNIQNDDKLLAAFSIYLDICNDLGLSIPIICHFKNIYFRGYRHGELGKRTEGNIFLFYKFLEAFCITNNYNIGKGIDSILLEKLAVIFFRIAAREEFIDVTYDYSDPSAINIGFYLMGAVMVNNDKVDFFPNNRNDWFINSYCGKILKSEKEDGHYKYSINEVPHDEGIPCKIGGLHKSKQLGYVLGKVIKTQNTDSKTIPIQHSNPININRLTILASCYSASDFAMALAAELNIIYNWLRFSVENILQKGNLINNSIFVKFDESTVYQAFNQALFKFVLTFSQTENVEKIINDASEFLNPDPLSKESWDYYSKKLGIGQDNRIEIKKLNPKLTDIIYKLSAILFRTGNWLHYVRFLLEVNENILNPRIGVNSKFEFINVKTGNPYTRQIVKKTKADKTLIKHFEIGYMTKIASHFRGKQLGDIVEFEDNGTSYKFQINKISNFDISFNSYLVFEKYNMDLYNKLKGNPVIEKMEELLPDNFLDIKQLMFKNRNNRNINELNAELAKTLNSLKQSEYTMNDLIKKTKEIYTSSRDNIASLLC
jgi:hypothetical protein